MILTIFTYFNETERKTETIPKVGRLTDEEIQLVHTKFCEDNDVYVLDGEEIQVDTSEHELDSMYGTWESDIILFDTDTNETTSDEELDSRKLGEIPPTSNQEPTS